jgi:hypothetical protein
MSFEASRTKRVRDESLSVSSFGSSALQVGSAAGGEPVASALTASALSFLSASAAGGACSIPSHARLEAVLRQTELMRRLDADAHEAMRAEMASHADTLRSHVSALASAVDSAAAQRLTQHEGLAASMVAAGAAKSSASSAEAESARLRAALAAALSERDEARTAFSALKREADAAAAASRSAVKRAESAAAASGAVVEDLQLQLTSALGTLEETRARLADAQHRLSAYSSVGGGGGGLGSSSISGRAAAAATAATPATAADADDLGVFFGESAAPAAPLALPNGAASAAEAAALRDEIRAARRRERAAADTIAALRAERGNATLLEDRIATLEARLSRADEAAQAVPALRERVRALAGALHAWDEEVYRPLLELAPSSAPAPGEEPSHLADAARADAIGARLASARAHAARSSEKLRDLQASSARAAEDVARAAARSAHACEKRAEAHARIDALERSLADAAAAAQRDAAALSLAVVREEATRGLADGLRATCHSYEAEDRAASAALAASEAARALSSAAAAAAAAGGLHQNARAALSSAVAAASAAASAASAAANACTQGIATRNKVAERERDALRAKVNELLGAAASLVTPTALALETARARSALAEATAARTEIDVLWSALEKSGGARGGAAGGDASEESAGLRVLHFAANPTSQAFRVWEEKQRALVATLRNEIEAFRASGVSARNDGSAVTTSTTISEDADKRLKRTIEMFRERAAIMRDAVCRLTGWKMDLHFGPVAASGASVAGEEDKIDIQLRSNYAEASTDYLHIRMQGAFQPERTPHGLKRYL